MLALSHRRGGVQNEFKHGNAVKEMAIDLHFPERGFDGPMLAIQRLAIQRSARRSTIEIVWRNRFPARCERSSGPPVLVVTNARVATPGWLQNLIRLRWLFR